MKKLAALSLILSSLTTSAFDFNVKGFIVLDLLGVEKEDDQDTSVNLGYGTADVKFYFNHEDFSSKIKLDIDGGGSDDSSGFDLMEEALVMYRPTRKAKFTFGKGKIRFHQMHHGVSERNYTDGGYILNPFHGLRDQDRKYLAALTYGRRKSGVVQHFTFFGNITEVRRDFNGQPYFRDPSGSGYDQLSYNDERTFNTKYQRGFAYKLELSPDYETKYSAAALSYWREVDPKTDWAFDLAYHKNTAEYEIWAEAIYAFISKHPNDSYAKKAQYDNLYQLGALKKINDKWAYGVNLEAAFVRNKHHNKNDFPSGGDYNFGQDSRNDGRTSKYDTYKVDIGVQYRAARRVQISSGVIFQRKFSWEPDNYSSRSLAHGELQYLGGETAYGFNTGLSFWF